MQNLVIPEVAAITYDGKKVFSTNQIADTYGCTPKVMIDCFRRHKTEFIEGVDYYRISGDELKAFKQNLQGLIGKTASSVHLWTKFGALKLSNILNAKNSAQKSFGRFHLFRRRNCRKAD